MNFPAATMKKAIDTSHPIIIVDDDTDDQHIFEEIIKNLEISKALKFFHNGNDALSYLRSTKDQPFIIFCDVNMPKMNGIELRQYINADENLRRKSIPFVFFTTTASVDQIRLAYDLTVQGFFIKESSYIETENTFKLIINYWEKCKHPNSVE